VALLSGLGAWTSLAWMNVKSGTAAPFSAPAQGARIPSSSAAANDKDSILRRGACADSWLLNKLTDAS
jgi:hypothetical protein